MQIRARKWVVWCKELGPFSIFFFLILFDEWACKEELVPTLVKNRLVEILFFLQDLW